MRRRSLRITEYIKVMLKSSDYFTNYRNYIETNGLIFDGTYDYIIKDLSVNNDFANLILNTPYRGIPIFFEDFKLFSKIYSYYIFYRQLQGKSEDDYIKNLDLLLMKYRDRRKQVKTGSDEIRQIDRGISSFVLLKKRMEEYKNLKRSIKKKDLDAVTAHEPELTEIYQRIIITDDKEQ